MSAATIGFLLGVAFGGTLGVLCMALAVAGDAPVPRPTLPERPNPHAHLLGQVVEARLYEGSDWERYIVVGVGWHGSLCIRRAAEPHGRGWWVKHSVLTADRFREVEA